MKQYTRQQTSLLMVQQRRGIDKDTKALRFQAYERIVLLCERIKLGELVLRLNNPSLDPKALRNIMLVSIQKEYEHNLTQQLYVSGQLWEMVELLKEQTINHVTSSYIEHRDDDLPIYVQDLINKGQLLNKNIGSTVISAVRKEVELYFS